MRSNRIGITRTKKVDVKVYFQKSTFLFLLDGPWLGSDGPSQSIGILPWLGSDGQSQSIGILPWLGSDGQSQSIGIFPLQSQRWTKSIHRNPTVAVFLCTLHSFGESIYHKNKNPGLLSTSKDFICKLILFLGVVSPGIEPGTQGFSVLCSTN